MRCATILTMTAMLSASAAAQQNPPATPNIQALQGKTVIDDADNTVIRGWVTDRANALTHGSRTAIGDLLRTNAGTPDFRQAYVAGCIQVLGSAYKNADQRAAAQMLTALGAFKEPAAYRVFVEALGDQRVSVRAAAARGLRILRKSIPQAGAAAFGEVLSALRDAGKKESAPVVLKLIFQAMNFREVLPNPPDPKLNAAAILDVLAARARQYADGSVKAVAADTPGLAAAAAVLAQYQDADRNRLIAATATMMRFALNRYADELHKVEDKKSGPLLIAQRNQIELLIRQGETLLTALLSPGAGRPDVFKQIGENKITEMKNQWAEWVKLLQAAVNTDFSLDKNG